MDNASSWREQATYQRAVDAPVIAIRAKAQGTALPQGAPPQLVAAIEDAVRDTLSRHGISAFLAPREATIAHEVGHAIVGTREGMAIKSLSIFLRRAPSSSAVWSGWCACDGTAWKTGPDTTAENDLSAARIIIAGLAGEAVTGQDLPGSSIDELALSQLVGCNAATKLADPALSEAEYWAYAERLWHEQVWGVAVSTLLDNRDVFTRLGALLHERQQIKGGKLRRVLALIKAGRAP